MLKNIKLFNTDNDRTTYESSANYETPYVSKVAADNSVHYNRPLRIISFTIDNVSYQALEGMTWEQWVNSEYNVVPNPYTGTGSQNGGNYYSFNNKISRSINLITTFLVCLAGVVPVLPQDNIIENYSYEEYNTPSNAD